MNHQHTEHRGAELPNSERIVVQILGDAGTGDSGDNATVPISEVIRVPGPAMIWLQAKRNAAGIYSDIYGFTSLRYTWISF